MIRAGELADPFPGEILLAARLGVSRPVLRDALRELAGQKVISIARGKRTRLLPARQSIPRMKKPHILALSSPRAGTGFRLTGGVFYEVREVLQSRGYLWSEFAEGRLTGGQSRKSLGERIRADAYDGILLHDSTKAQQEWITGFATPALVLGSTFPGVDLPSLDNDYHALGWHAAGRLAASGHQRMGVLLRDPLRQGDEATMEGMREYFAQHTKGDSRVSTCILTGEGEEICRQLERILRGPNAPSVLVIFYPVDVITAVTYLLQSGRGIPKDIAILSRESIPIMSAMVPAVTRYERDEARLRRRAVLSLESLCHAQPLRQSQVRIIPRFVKGATL